MRYAREHKEQTRQRLVERGARLAKQRGFAAAGVDDLAAAAGVTSGAVYKQFSGKSELLSAIIEAELARSAAMFTAVPPGDAARLDKVIAGYLSTAHVEHPESGCPLPSLTPDVARAGDEVRQAFEDGLRAVHAAIKRHVNDGDVAWTLIAQAVGAVMLARAIPADATRAKVLAAVKRSARAAVASRSERSGPPDKPQK